MPDPERAVYDEGRFDYHSQMVTVATATIRRVNQQGRLLTLMNRREVGARRGMIVSGPWTTGKSTALKQLGRTHELMIRQRFPDSDRIPVVYVTCPPKGSPRQLAVEFARFLGLPPGQAQIQRRRHRRHRLPAAQRWAHRPGAGGRDPQPEPGDQRRRGHV